MELQEIYAQLKGLNMCKSGYQFSEQFLGMHRSYYSVILAQKAQPSINVLSTLEYVLILLVSVLNDVDSFEVLNRRNKLQCLVELVRSKINYLCKSRVKS
ncbi:DUF6626 family protein [Litorilituus lipolyticus]|uniref:DUF6626 family protein n=1 Tax=Litorilituus lipolyticus TaxID=2491017 RepID=UPI003CCC6797